MLGAREYAMLVVFGIGALMVVVGFGLAHFTASKGDKWASFSLKSGYWGFTSLLATWGLLAAVFGVPSQVLRFTEIGDNFWFACLGLLATASIAAVCFTGVWLTWKTIRSID